MEWCSCSHQDFELVLVLLPIPKLSSCRHGFPRFSGPLDQFSVFYYIMFNWCSNYQMQKLTDYLPWPMNQIQIAASEKTVRLLRTKKAAKNFQFLLAHNRAANALTMLGLLYRLSSVIITTYTEKPVQNSIKPTFFCRFKTLVGRRKLGRDKDIRPLELSSLEQILQCLFGILVLVPRGCIKCMSRYLSDELFVPVDCSRVDQSVAMFAEC